MTLNEIFTFENMFYAHNLCRRSKQHKRGTITMELELGQNIEKLIKSLVTRKYRVGKYRQFKIYDPKERIIRALPYPDRVIQMCFCKNSMAPRLENRLIYDNVASRTGRGTDFAIRRIHGFMWASFIQTGGNNAYFLKCDISKYFQNINHDILLSQLRRAGFGPDEMWFMTQVIKSTDESCGVPLGNQTSQWFALLYLNDMDRMIKEKLRVQHYIRYMDDFILIHPDKAFLQKCKSEIEQFCNEKLKLQLNSKTQIGQLKNGLDFLGFNHKLGPTGKISRKIRASARIRQRKYINNIARFYMADIIDDEYLNTRRASFRGHMIGTPDYKFMINRINTLRRQKRIMTKNTTTMTCKSDKNRIK